MVSSNIYNIHDKNNHDKACHEFVITLYLEYFFNSFNANVGLKIKTKFWTSCTEVQFQAMNCFCYIWKFILGTT